MNPRLDAMYSVRHGVGRWTTEPVMARFRPGVQSPAVRALFADDPLAARTPVLLVHGLVDNRSVFAIMRRSLRRRGFASVCSWNYSPMLVCDLPDD